MTLCDHVINRLCGFEDNRLALEPTTLSSLVAICLAKLKHNVFCQLCDDLIICSKHQKTWFMVTHTIYLYLFKFSSHRPRGSEDISFLIWQVTSYGHADLLNLLKKTLMENFIFVQCLEIMNSLLLQGFISLTLTTHGTTGEGGRLSLFYSSTSRGSRIFRKLFATMHVRWRSHIFIGTACIYQTATRWDLSPYRITIWQC